MLGTQPLAIILNSSTPRLRELRMDSLAASAARLEPYIGGLSVRSSPGKPRQLTILAQTSGNISGWFADFLPMANRRGLILPPLFQQR
jgi:hypothetical protein